MNIYKRFRSSMGSWVGICFSFLVISLIFIIPIIHNAGIMEAGHDSNFHLSRMYSLYNTFNGHHLIPGFDYNSFGNRGTMSNVFYPYTLTILPIVVFYFFIKNWAVSIQLFFFLSTFLTLFIAFKASLRLTHSKIQSYLFAVLYVFSHYRIINSYVRFDIGEYMAMVFIPLVLFELETMIQRHDYTHWYLIAIGMSGIIYSHLLSGVVISIVILLRMLLGITSVNKQTINYFLKAVFLSLLLSIFEIVSVVEQFMHIKLTAVDRGDSLLQALSSSDVLKMSLNSELKPVVGFVVIFTVLICLLNFSKLQINHINVAILFVVGLVFLFLTTSSFPWYLLNHKPIDMLQFPFRLSVYATIYLLLSGTVVIANLSKRMILSANNRAIIGLIALCLLGMYGQVTKMVSDRANEKLQTEYHLTNKFNILAFKDSPIRDYRPSTNGFLGNSLETRQFSLNHHDYGAPIYLQTKSNMYFFTVDTTNKDTLVDIPIPDYVGVAAFERNRQIPTYRTKRGTIEIRLNKVGRHTIVVTSVSSLAKKIAFVVSILAVILLLIIVYFRQRPDSDKVNKNNYED